MSGLTPNEVLAQMDAAREQFLADVRAVVSDHWSGLPEDRPEESVWSRLDAVLFDDDGNPRPEPDWTASLSIGAFRVEGR